eukprot:TRINITY_DN4863_c0_g1_i8.p1 TRINITY_DN4863_c0_g1~~TRINITY_DN4863_c0_g1_i8.p1  ORF type:complete len:308 (-),score=42.84 TRINITY_DN4863_c0_g1_i8:145-1068(-)
MEHVHARDVVGQAGRKRMLDCLQYTFASITVVEVTLFVSGFVLGRVLWICGLVVVGCVLLITIYNLWADGPWRCMDISPEVHFRVSSTDLEVFAWGGFFPKRWAQNEIQCIGVYRQASHYKFCRKTTRGNPEIITQLDQVAEDLPGLSSPLRLCCCRAQCYSSAFLGATLSNDTLVMLSNYVWHREGVEELLELSRDIQLFREGSLYRAQQVPFGRSIGGSEGEISALPARSFSRNTYSFASGSDSVDCSICLHSIHEDCLACELPCSHVFHSDCIREWLRFSRTCPMCKRSIAPKPTPDAVGFAEV